MENALSDYGIRQNGLPKVYKLQNPPLTSSTTAFPSAVKSVRQLQRDARFGLLPSYLFTDCVARARLGRLNPFNPFVTEYIINANRFLDSGWEYLDISPNGKTLAVCNTLYKRTRRNTQIQSFHVQYNAEHRDKEIDRRQLDRMDRKPVDSAGYNVMGLRYNTVYNSCSTIYDSRVVEMVRANFDTDITCVLSVFASENHRRPCHVVLHPLLGFNRPAEETSEQADFVLYNKYWDLREPSWSGAFDSKNLRISVGQDQKSRIIDILSDTQFTVPSRKKPVISQAFSSDGNCLLTGRVDADVSIIDLRDATSQASSLSCKSAGFVASLKSNPHVVITENFSGTVKKWDLRQMKPILEFNGHSNHHNKVPCHIDNNERFIFAVDDEGNTRGWALNDGSLICTIPRLKNPGKPTYFPRVVYSDNWGDKSDNAGLLLALNNNFYMYDLFP